MRYMILIEINIVSGRVITKVDMTIGIRIIKIDITIEIIQVVI